MRKIPFVALFALLILTNAWLCCGYQANDLTPEHASLTINASGLDLPYAQTVSIQNNSSELFDISNNGAEKFSTLHKTGDAFDLNILSQSVLQNCSLSPTSGNFASAGTTVNLTCIDKTWTHPSDLNDTISMNGQHVHSLRIAMAMDNHNNALVVWAQSNGSNDQIFKSEYRNGAWTHPADLNDNISPDAQDAQYPAVAMDDNGNAIITWVQSNGSNNQIFKSEFRSATWIHPADLNDNISPDTQDAQYPAVAMDDNGNAIITWVQSNGSNNQIFKSEFRSATWIHPADLNDNISPDTQDAQYPDLAMDNNGNAIITWFQSNGSNNQIFKSEFRSGSWAHPSSLSDNISPNAQDAQYPVVAMDNSTNAIITWHQSDSSTTQIFKSEYRSAAWTHPTDLNDHISISGQPALIPRIAMDDHDNAIIVWQQSTPSNIQIFKSEFRNAVWTHPIDIDDTVSPGGQNAYAPIVSLDNHDNALITWAQNDGVNNQIFKSEYFNGLWSFPQDTADNISPDGQYAFSNQGLLNDLGMALIAWVQSDGSFRQIFISEFK